MSTLLVFVGSNTGVGTLPGTSSASSMKLRPFSGSASISRASSTPSTAVSRTRVDALAETVSCTDPSRSWMVSTCSWPTRSVMPVARQSANPVSCTSTVYGPGGRLGTAKRPSAALTDVHVAPVPAWRTETVAPGAGLLCGSLTRPASVATANCASAARARRRAAAAQTATIRQDRLFIVISGVDLDWGLRVTLRPSHGCRQRHRIAVLGHMPGPLAVPLGVGGRPRAKTVDVAVEHAERGGDQHGVVDFRVGGAFAPRPLDVLNADRAAALLHTRGDSQKRPQLRRDRGCIRASQDLVNQRLVLEMTRGDGRVAGATERAVVERRDVCSDQLPISARETVWRVQEGLRQRGDRTSGFRARLQKTAHPGNPRRD